MAGSYWGRGTHCHPTSLFAMEAFNRLFKSKVLSSSIFKYHPHCKGQQITHLSFADDLLIFSVSDLSSIHIIKNPLKNSNISLDCIKPSKSEVLCSSISDSSKKQILEVLQFKEGSLLVRYLGMPLIPSKFSFKDCQPLLDKILARINSWTTRNLSVSRRLQWLQPVLNIIQNLCWNWTLL